MDTGDWGAGVVRGFRKNQSTQRLQQFSIVIASEEVLLFDQAAAELAGRIAGDLDRAGLRSTTSTSSPAIRLITNAFNSLAISSYW